MSTNDRPKVNFDAKTGDVIRIGVTDYRVIDSYPKGINVVDLVRMDDLNLSTPEAMRSAFKQNEYKYEDLVGPFKRWLSYEEAIDMEAVYPFGPA